MSVLLNWITAISMVALGTLLFYRDFKARSGKCVILHAVILLACVAFLWRFFGFLTPELVAKGDNNEVIFIIVLYLLMVLGMLASYAFQHFSKEKMERKEWDIGLFLAPVFVSPVIFIPLLTAFQQAAATQQAGGDSPRMMMFLVAFQNGFLWKEYFDHKRKKVTQDGT
ncbi:hypothetical protein IIA28_11865 [candidate division KSB1 bacterium]|nr:hypothetical protein [candidate division KSB1 bacterium]